jgi:RNA polymerase subunit RPABC4/transcription elongation factor Spt4
MTVHTKIYYCEDCTSIVTKDTICGNCNKETTEIGWFENGES